MTPKEALQYQRKGGKLYEPITPRMLHTLDVDEYFKQRGMAVNITYLPATNPRPEDGK